MQCKQMIVPIGRREARVDKKGSKARRGREVRIGMKARKGRKREELCALTQSGPQCQKRLHPTTAPVRLRRIWQEERCGRQRTWRTHYLRPLSLVLDRYEERHGRLGQRFWTQRYIPDMGGRGRKIPCIQESNNWSKTLKTRTRSRCVRTRRRDNLQRHVPDADR